ncbi:hypothetical protein [Cryobacterium serini]|uniref:Uncharacterized protein n=1 Tax=Cryobacterium serini TaxID=1259201 RepID=A0A4R9BKW3_9MICO|nr:hypothetical protein [Cryobacterium serini]TFD86116.1 hypothetical protein E3T51_13335 [Cryobacterium serini]
MAIRDLLNAGEAPVQARRVFTNRVSEAEAFFDAIDRIRAGADQLNLSGARTNVLSFYGHGGIGKSALSKHLERLALDRTNSKGLPANVSLRYDLSSTSARDAESILLALRASLAHAGIKAPAFDLAFSFYWSETHPGQPLTEYLSPSTFANQAGDSIDLGSIMQDAASDIVSVVADVASFGGVGTAFRLTKKLAATVSQNLMHSRILKNCLYLRDALIEENMSDLRTFLPHFLSWDLHQIQTTTDPHSSATFVVFFDSWEDVQADSISRGCLEDVLSQLVFLMPNVLFVITGRERLQWGDKGSEAYLARTGAINWPGLTLSQSGETNQHLLGALSHKDSTAFVVGATAAQPIDPTVLSALITQSGGHPDFLDAIVDLWQSATSNGESLTAESASGGLAQVYQRVFRGLFPIEQDLLMAAALVPALNEQILASLVPQAAPSEVTRFLSRHFIENTSAKWLSRRLRPSVTDLVTAARRTSSQLWSPAQVAVAVAAAVEAVLDGCLASAGAATFESSTKLDQAVKFVVDVEQNGAALPSRTVDLIFAANTSGSGGRLFDSELGLRSRYFSQVLRSVITLESSQAPNIDLPPIGTPDWLVDTQAVAEARRLLLAGDLPRSAAIMGTITDSTPAIAHRRAKLEILFASRSGRLKRGRELAKEWPIADERNDLLGHIAYWQGQFTLAHEHFDQAAASARADQRDLEFARALRHQARVEAIMNHPNVDMTLDAAQVANSAIDSQIGQAQVCGARGIVAARRGNAEESITWLHSALADFEQTGAIIDVASLCVAGAMTGRLLQRPDIVDEWSTRLKQTFGETEDARLYARSIAFVGGTLVAANADLGDDYDVPIDSARAWFAAGVPKTA